MKLVSSRAPSLWQRFKAWVRNERKLAEKYIEHLKSYLK